jgi:hypothetical protein
MQRNINFSAKDDKVEYSSNVVVPPFFKVLQLFLYLIVNVA